MSSYLPSPGKGPEGISSPPLVHPFTKALSQNCLLVMSLQGKISKIFKGKTLTFKKTVLDLGAFMRLDTF